ncbi:hypothetical protein DFH28DRAFT_939283 [Melampsora americana]|nr:hypothetical protein DFH28DRAFT_939283 [Melampsora americana]
MAKHSRYLSRSLTDRSSPEQTVRRRIPERNQDPRLDLLSPRGATDDCGSQAGANNSESTAGRPNQPPQASDDWPDEEDTDEDSSSSEEELDLKPMPVTQSGKLKCKIESAAEQFGLARQFYLCTKENMQGVLASYDPVLIGREMELMKHTLQAIRRSLRAKERKLNRAVERRHPSIRILQRELSPLDFRPRSSNAGTQLPARDIYAKREDVNRPGLPTSDPAMGDDGPALPDGATQAVSENIAGDQPQSTNAQQPPRHPTAAPQVNPAPPAPAPAAVVTAARRKAAKKKPAAPPKSAEFVDAEDMIQPPEDSVQDSTQPTKSTGPRANDGEEVVIPEPKKKKGKAKMHADRADEPFQLCVNKNHEFHKAKIDLAKLLKDKTDDESHRILVFEDSIANGQFSWGEVLSYPIRNILQDWNYDAQTEAGKAGPNDLNQFVFLMKDMTDDAKMMTRFKSAPCLLQLHEHDPFFRPKNINWAYVGRATEYPYKHRNAVLKALHGMACRSDDSEKWTSEPVLQSELGAGYRGLKLCLQEALDQVSLQTEHNEIEIKTEGQDAVHSKLVELSKCMAWLHRQTVVQARQDEVVKKTSTRNPPHGLAWLKRKYFLVLLGILIVYESEQLDDEIELAENSRRPPAKIAAIKAKLKDASCIRQLVRENLRTKKLAIKGTSEQGAIEGDGAPTDDEFRRAVSEYRRDVLRNLAVFLAFGTAGMFHVWPGAHEQSMSEGALLIHFTSLLVDRRRLAVGDEPWGYGCRAWNRMDNHLFKLLKLFLNDAGDFRPNINWATMTSRFQYDFDTSIIAHLLTLDIQCEIVLPGLSRTLSGTVAPPLKDKDKAVQLLRPSQVRFRRMFGPTEGTLHPVSNRGQGLHPEKQVSRDDPSKQTFTRQDNSVAQRSLDQAKARENAANKRAVTEVRAPGGGKKRRLVNGVSEQVASSSAAASQSQTPNDENA